MNELIITQAKRLLTLPGVELLFDAQYDAGEPGITEGLTRDGTRFVSCSVTSPRAQTFTLYLSNPGGLSPEDEDELSYVNSVLWDQTYPRLYDAVCEAERTFGQDCCAEVRALQRHHIYFEASRQLDPVVWQLLFDIAEDKEEAGKVAVVVAALQLARGLLETIPPYGSDGRPLREVDVDMACSFRKRTVERLQDAVHDWDLRVATMAVEEEEAGLK